MNENKYRWTFLHLENNKEYNLVAPSADAALSWLERVLGTKATLQLLAVAELGSSRWLPVISM